MGIIINELETVADSTSAPAQAPDDLSSERATEQALDPMALDAGLRDLAEQAARVWAH
jgi:hypothetical protein